MTLPHNTNNLRRRAAALATWLAAWAQRRPHYVAALLIGLDLLLFQRSFLLGGDVWAEAYPEYLITAADTGWMGFFHIGWAGYFNFLPRLLVNLYLWLNLPVGYIDHFFRLSVIAFAAACIIFIAHPYNRAVIKNDWLRIAAAILTMFTLYHVSSFSFINVWYMGFAVVALVSLHHERFKLELSAVAYAAIAMAVVLTKPSILLLPLVLYRTIRLKEYLLGFIISFAIGLETLLLLASSYLSQPGAAKVGLKHEIATIVLGSGLMTLKTFRIFPSHLWMLALGVLALGLAAAMICLRGKLWRGLVILLSLALALYTYFFAPDVASPSIFHNSQAVFLDQFKLQRELMISFFIILVVAMALDYLTDRYQLVLRRRIALRWSLVVVLLLFIVHAYRPIDTQNAAITADLTQFRADLTHHVSVCMPIAPTPANPDASGVVGHQTAWFLQYYGGCEQINNGTKTFDARLLVDNIGPGWPLTVPAPADRVLKSVMIPLSNPQPAVGRHLLIRDLTTGRTFPANLPAKTNGEALSLIAFNLAAETPQASYNLLLTEVGTSKSTVKAGRFAEGDQAYYGFLMGVPNYGDYAHHLETLKKAQPPK